MSTPNVAEELALQERVNAAVARETRRLKGEISERDAKLAELRKLLDFSTAIEQAKIRPAEWKQPERAKPNVGIPATLLTDTHFEEIIRPEEVGFFNAYDRRIGELRLRRWSDSIIKVAHDDLSNVEYPGLVVMVGGDIFSGNIHAELVETNAGTLFEGFVHWLDLVLSSFRQLADGFGRVELDMVVGNHGRMTQKPRFKVAAHDNVEWLFYKIIARELAGDDRFTINIADGIDLRVNILNTRYLLRHGHGLTRSMSAGTGSAGNLSPLMIGRSRAERREIAAGQPFDWLVVGHFHQHWIGRGVIAGGTAKGVDELAWSGQYEPEPATQAFWLTDPRYGVTVNLPIFVQRDRQSEGW